MINIAFSKYVKMNGRQWEVNFRRLPGSNDCFSVDTPDLTGERYMFMLNKAQETNWELDGRDLPNWLSESLPGLVSAAQTGLQEYGVFR